MNDTNTTILEFLKEQIKNLDEGNIETILGLSIYLDEQVKGNPVDEGKVGMEFTATLSGDLLEKKEQMIKDGFKIENIDIDNIKLNNSDYELHEKIIEIVNKIKKEDDNKTSVIISDDVKSDGYPLKDIKEDALETEETETEVKEEEDKETEIEVKEEAKETETEVKEEEAKETGKSLAVTANNTQEKKIDKENSEEAKKSEVTEETTIERSNYTNISVAALTYRGIHNLSQNHQETLKNSNKTQYGEEIKNIQLETEAALKVEYKKVENKKKAMDAIFAKNNKINSKREANLAIIDRKKTKKKLIGNLEKSIKNLNTENTENTKIVTQLMQEKNELENELKNGVTIPTDNVNTSPYKRTENAKQLSYEKPEVMSADITRADEDVENVSLPNWLPQLRLSYDRAINPDLIPEDVEEQNKKYGTALVTVDNNEQKKEYGTALVTVDNNDQKKKVTTTEEVIALDKREQEIKNRIKEIDEKMMELDSKERSNNRKIDNAKADIEDAKANANFNLKQDNMSEKLFNILEAKKTISVFEEIGIPINEELIEKINQIELYLRNGFNEDKIEALYKEIETGMFETIDNEYAKIPKATYVDRLFLNNTVKLPYSKGNTLGSLSTINDKLELQSDILAKNSTQYKYDSEDKDLHVHFGKINKLEKLLDTTYAIGEDMNLSSMMSQNDIAKLKYGIDAKVDLSNTTSLQDKYSNQSVKDSRRMQLYNSVQNHHKEKSAKKIIGMSSEELEKLETENLQNLFNTLPGQIEFYKNKVEELSGPSFRIDEIHSLLEDKETPVTDEERLKLETELVSINTKFPDAQNQLELFVKLGVHFSNQLTNIEQQLKDKGVEIETKKEEETTTEKEEETTIEKEESKKEDEVIDVEIVEDDEEVISEMLKIFKEHGKGEKEVTALFLIFEKHGVDKKTALDKVKDYIRVGGKVEKLIESFSEIKEHKSPFLREDKPESMLDMIAGEIPADKLVEAANKKQQLQITYKGKM